jgi:glycosyltransferase involved in cell wall biosynthesis
MNILYDYQTFRFRFSGIARYHYELSKGIESKGFKTQIATLFTQSEYLLKDPRYKVINLLGYKKFRGRYTMSNFVEELNQKYAVSQVKKNKFDLFHPTYYDPYFLPQLHKPLVITVHDFVHEKFDPDRTGDIANKKLLIEKADKIIAISQNTKNDILTYYNPPADKIQVIYHGIHDIKMPYLNNPYGSYILFVGDRKGYKNFANFLKATALILKKDRGLKLVCTGNPFTDQETDLINSYAVTDQIVQVSASDRELNSLYRHARVFVYPSFYEGFGMPILEAFCNECPICISYASCFPEIAQDAACYFDPGSIDSIQYAIEKVIYDNDFRNILIERGNKLRTNFSWEKTIQQTMKLYQQVI